MIARFVLNSGLALEAFYVLTGYTRKHYLIVTAAGIAAWITQSFLGVTVLAAALAASPWILIAAIGVPLGSVVALIRWQRRRSTHASPQDSSAPSRRSGPAEPG